MQRLQPEEGTPAAVTAFLRKLGAGPTCHVVAASHLETDGQAIASDAALAAVVGKSHDALLYFQAASLAYYENHESEQFLLRAKAP